MISLISSGRASLPLLRCSLAVVLSSASASQPAPAQTSPAASRQSGTVKSTAVDGFVLTTTAGQDVTVTIPSGAKVLIVPPGSKDLTAASDGSIADVQPGDRALVSGAQAGSESAFKATRVVLMKSSAIAQTHAAEEAAWGHGGGGIVKSVDTSANIVTVSSGLRTVTVTLQPATVVRRYAGDSVRFEDAKPSSLAAIHAGDQLRVRGTRAPDGSSIAADEIVTGTFRNFSGLLSSVDPSTGTVSLKDLATGKTVVVSVTPNSDVRRLPAPIAQVMAARMRGTAPGAGTNGQVRAGGQAAAPEASAPSPRTPGGEAGGTAGAPGGARRAGMDLSQMLSRLPTETLAGLKAGEAVMIVATSPSADSDRSSAVTLLAGVEPILSASPRGQTMTLSPWSVGGEPGAGMGGEGAGGPGR